MTGRGPSTGAGGSEHGARSRVSGTVPGGGILGRVTDTGSNVGEAMGETSGGQDAQQPAGFLYRVPGPGDTGPMWIARDTTGQVAHGRTPEAAVERLASLILALAEEKGLTAGEWMARHRDDNARAVMRGELRQA